ncbi:MAG TPA: thymidylate kinase [Actinomycetota bacterium]|nr:thymidylate kinase [Actinomycetota bacterium]
MTELKFYGDRPPGIEGTALPGRLIVIEGTDGVGRSTHIALLKEWLEDRGIAVLDTGLTRSELAGPGIKRAKEGNTLDPFTLNLFYATDFWDRLERQIFPALRAGMVALADRYVFSLIARAVIRGVSPEWMEDLYGFALVPDCVIYLDIDVEHLLPRVISSTGFDYWESGQDFLPSTSVFDTFVEYQTWLLDEFRRLATRHDFHVIDARGSVPEIFRAIATQVEEVVAGMGQDAPIVELLEEPSAEAATVTSPRRE